MFVMRLIMPRLYLGILLIHGLRAATFSGKFVSNSDKGKPVKDHVEGQLS